MDYPTIASQTSGTTNAQPMLVMDIIRRAYSRAGMTEGTQTPEMLDQAKQSLNLAMQNLLNRGLPLFSIEQSLLGMTPGVVEYELPEKVYEIEECVWRTTNSLQYVCTGGTDPQYLTGTDYFAYATTTTNFIASFIISGTPEYLNQQGLFFFGAQTVTLTFSYSVDGTTYIPFDTVESTTYKDGQWLWRQYPQGYTAYYIKVECASGETLSLRSWYLTNTVTAMDLPISRVSRGTYHSYPMKDLAGSPILYYFEKTLSPKLFIWGVPNDIYNWQIFMRWKVQLQDCGKLTNTLQAPPWYLNSLIYTLAKDLCLEANGTNNLTERYQLLKGEAEQSIAQAIAANADKAPVSLIPNFSCYTA